MNRGLTSSISTSDVVGHVRLGEQHVHVPRHPAGDGVDAEHDVDALIAQDLGELGRGVVRAGDGEPVAGHDDDPLRVVEQDRDVVGLHRAHRPVRSAPPTCSPATCARNAPNTMPATVRPMALAIAIVRIVPLAPTSVPAISSRTFDEHETGCRHREPRERVEQRDHDRHVGAADREHEQHAEHAGRPRAGGRRRARRRSATSATPAATAASDEQHHEHPQAREGHRLRGDDALQLAERDERSGERDTADQDRERRRRPGSTGSRCGRSRRARRAPRRRRRRR